MKLAVSSGGELWPTGEVSKTETSPPGLVISREFFAGRPVSLPNTSAIGDVIARFDRDPTRKEAMRQARIELASELYARKSGGLSALRMSRGFSQASLAQAVKSSQPHIAKIESGKNDPGTSLIVRIAEALGVDATDVFRAIRSDQTEAESSPL